MPKVSVIIPSFNHARFICDAIDSVLSQTYSDFEVLISDDCSADCTLQLFDSYRSNPKVKIFNQLTHLGAVEQIHFLTDRTQGDYIALLNSDDYWKSDKLEKQVLYLDEHSEIYACFTHANMVDASGTLINQIQDPFSDIFKQPNRSRLGWLTYFMSNPNCLCHPSVLARRGLYQGQYRLNQGFRQLPDFELWTRVLLDYEIHILQDVLTFHRRIRRENTSAITQKNINLHLREQAWIRSRMIEKMLDDDFQEIFHERMIRKDAAGADIDCEKFFVLSWLGEKDPLILERAVDYYWRHAMDSVFVETMMQIYKFSDTDFFELSSRLGEFRKQDLSLRNVVNSGVELIRKKLRP